MNKIPNDEIGTLGGVMSAAGTQLYCVSFFCHICRQQTVILMICENYSGRLYGANC